MDYIIGYRYNEYTNKEGKLVKGYEIYSCRPLKRDGVVADGVGWYVGYGANAKPTRPAWVSVDLFNALAKSLNNKIVGAKVEMLFNRYGGVEQIVPCVN